MSGSPERHMVDELDRVFDWLAELGIHIITPVEHSIVPALRAHSLWLTVPPHRRPNLHEIWGPARGRSYACNYGWPPEGGYGGGTEHPRLVVEHPDVCGCDLLPDHVLLEG